MATDVNKGNRKRKSTTDLIFEVNEGDCSSASSPEPVIEIVSGSLSETEASSQASTDNLKVGLSSKSLDENNAVMLLDSDSKESSVKSSPEVTVAKIETSILNDDLSCMPIPDKKLKLSEHSTLDSTDLRSKLNNKSKSQQLKLNDYKANQDFSKLDDADLRCMDMEVASPQSGVGKPFITLIFRNRDVANAHKSRLINFIKNLVDFKLNEETESEVELNFWEDNIVDSPNENTELANDLFVVDTTPSKSSEYLPRYLPKRCEVIDDTEQEHTEEEQKNNLPRLNCCFNCEGNHALKDCKEPRNHRRISMARSKYMANNQQSKSVRYHLDDDQKFKHLVPGRISDQLRKALNIRNNEVPKYVYRMRLMGYPPGWIKEATITSSNLELFDFQGCIVSDSTNKPLLEEIDPEKIIDYPGFNVPLAKGTRDEYKYYNCPPYNEMYSKRAMLSFIERANEQSRAMQMQHRQVTPSGRAIRKSPTPAPIPTPTSPLVTATVSVPLPASESDSNSQECQVDKKRCISPSLTDLELRKRQLLEELEDASDNNAVVKSSCMGTPVLKSASPYSYLPDRDKFSKDISQVINFENLPNSTGKYEQMSKVIGKVRHTVKSANSNEQKS